ncbi:MAG TPA: hypothetical protein VNV66_00250 [Pilimelia sp.]|nr:hypothetical protein [Pilimelia sp.]
MPHDSTPRDSVTDVAGGDPRLAAVLRAHLRRLAEGPPGPLREMAEGVLRGEVDLRQAAHSQAYGAELGAAFRRFWSDYQAMSQRERDQLVERTREHFDGVVEKPPPGPE